MEEKLILKYREAAEKACLKTLLREAHIRWIEIFGEEEASETKGNASAIRSMNNVGAGHA